MDDDENEFKEEDVWDTDARREWPEDSSTHESSSSSSPQHIHQQQRETMMYHQSAPVNVPDWTRIVGTEKSSAAGWGNDSSLDHEKVDDDDNEEERLPPHELLAREYANSQATTFSVFEGAGRTLKGRDLSRVRNAVLRKTGFIDF
ncbi:unnamed protein product [Sphagnum compactum]